MKNTVSNTPTKIFKAVWTSSVYLGLRMALCLVLCTLGLVLSRECWRKQTEHHQVRWGFGVRHDHRVDPRAPYLLDRYVGEITGFYVDASGVGHGFLRTLGGTITTFEAPGAGTAALARAPFR